MTGIDISPTAIDWARDRLPLQTFHCGAVINPGSLPALTYDLLIDSNCLHCIIGKDRAKLLVNILDWMRPGGYLLLHTMCNEPVGNLLTGYDPTDRVVISKGIATRYLGTAPSILQQVASSGFHSLQYRICPQKDRPDMLVSLHQKRPIGKGGFIGKGKF